MNTGKAVCAHCGRVSTDILVPLNYLCIWCAARVTDVLDRYVRLSDASGTASEYSPAAVLGATHDDGTACQEVMDRRRVYVDGIAYEALGGTDGTNLARMLEVVEPPAWQTAPGHGEEELLWQGTATFLARQLRMLTSSDYFLVDYDGGEPEPAAYACIALVGTQFSCHLRPEVTAPGFGRPQDSEFLLARGWQPPTGAMPNWHQGFATGLEAVQHVLEGLRRALGCTEHKRLSWRFEEYE
ncbi:TY-Chap domain-containing protein [Arthrobacter sp. A2-55]|uniref:TY-Chap domain-containing protein n=1 Tax=Arthrobacter sp. A2-55 TaxID=2897337 RepID=UPI0021CDB64C|nr:hypothetical protein [Arthrobacter sp. A2-55]MCU6482465.1 hypothetical protein [Arthrobacter sp. A2-55]